MTDVLDPFAMPTVEPEDKLAKDGNFIPFVPLSAMADNRLMLMIPVSLERSVDTGFKDEKTGEPKYGPLLMAHIAVLTGEGQFVYMGKDENGAKAERTYEVEIVPGQSAAVFKNVFVRPPAVVDRTEDARRTDKPEVMTIGRLRKPQNAYKLAAPSEADLTIARKWLATTAGQEFKAEGDALHAERVAAATGDSAASGEKTPFD